MRRKNRRSSRLTILQIHPVPRLQFSKTNKSSFKAKQILIRAHVLPVCYCIQTILWYIINGTSPSNPFFSIRYYISFHLPSLQFTLTISLHAVRRCSELLALYLLTSTRDWNSVNYRNIHTGSWRSQPLLAVCQTDSEGFFLLRVLFVLSRTPETTPPDESVIRHSVLSALSYQPRCGHSACVQQHQPKKESSCFVLLVLNCRFNLMDVWGRDFHVDG